MVQLYALAQGRQPAARGQHVRGDMRKRLLTLSLVKPRQNAEAILKTYELLVYDDRHYITTLFCKNMLRVATLGQSCPHYIKG